MSLSDDDVAVLDAYVENAGLPSRSAGLQRAVKMLRCPTLEDDYAAAWEHWSTDEETAGGWERTAADGVGDAPR